jgi:hypothetical protein
VRAREFLLPHVRASRSFQKTRDKSGSDKLPKNSQPVVPLITDVIGQDNDSSDPKNELLPTLLGNSLSVESDQKGGSSAETIPQGRRQDSMIGISAAQLHDLISISVERGLRNINERVSTIADKLESLENASATRSYLQGLTAVSNPEVTTANYGDISEPEVILEHSEKTINIAEQSTVEVSCSEKQVLRPHDFIMNPWRVELKKTSAKLSTTPLLLFRKSYLRWF